MSRAPRSSSPRTNWMEAGLAAAESGQLATAALHFERAVKEDGRHAGHWFNLATVRAQLGDIEAAATALTMALRHKPGWGEPARRLSSLLSRYRLERPDVLDPFGLKAGLAAEGIDRQPLATAALARLAAGDLGEALARGRAEGWLEAARALVLRKTAKALRDDLLLAALSHGVVTDPDIERLLTAVRRVILLEAERERLTDRALVAFCCALAAHGIASDHAMAESAEERAALDALRPDGERLLAGDVAEARTLLLAALYRPIERLLGGPPDAAASAGTAIGPLRTLARTRAAELADEAAHMESIPTLGTIADATSRRVAGQYERSPYPRWTGLLPPRAGAARRDLARYFSPERLAFMDEPFEVLVAGAGTGRHAIASALAYGPTARVLAIDLSRRSLAYARRMAERYAAENLEFAQADILGLGDTGRRFHVVEAVGVLHHMADPFAGWRALLDRLRPEGPMLVGLYSALSRRNVAALRADPAWPGAGCDDEAARDYRALLMGRAPGEPGAELLASEDFHALNAFRDLVLHEHEAPTTLADIAAFMRDNRLAFRGFVLRGEHWRAFAAAHPDDPFPGTLANWETFEREHPRFFDGMYVFWCDRDG